MDWSPKSCIIRIWKSQTNFKSPSRLSNTICSLTFSQQRQISICPRLRTTNSIHFGTPFWTPNTISILRRSHERNFWILRRSAWQGLHRTWDPRVMQKTSDQIRPWCVPRSLLNLRGISRRHLRFFKRTLSPFFSALPPGGCFFWKPLDKVAHAS